jgi:hypothetical protein
MYCPNCATQNADGSKFCRSCGANIALVPMAMTGQIEEIQVAAQPPELPERGRRRRRNRQPSPEQGIKNIFIGIGFLTVAIALSFNHANWWFWLLIPAFAMVGGGIAECVKGRRSVPQISGEASATGTALKPPLYSAPELPRATNELTPQPPSVTEGTTRHLGVEKVRSPYDRS